VERDGEAELDARQIERSQARHDFAPWFPKPVAATMAPATGLPSTFSAAREAIVSSGAHATRPS
jgi:hypothetical protein